LIELILNSENKINKFNNVKKASIFVPVPEEQRKRGSFVHYFNSPSKNFYFYFFKKKKTSSINTFLLCLKKKPSISLEISSSFFFQKLI
jgi:hypothetical protein